MEIYAYARRKGMDLGFGLVLMAALLASCEESFGTKNDPAVDDVFEEGAVDPTLVPQDVGYVPIFPAWEGFSKPVDVFVGYDEMVYVVDDEGVHVLDQTGARQQLIPIPEAVEVTQDRQLRTWITGRIDTTVMVEGEEQVYSLPAIYILRFTSTPDYEALDTLVNPFDDGSRYTASSILQGIRPADEEVSFHGIDVTADGEVYVARSGPSNDVTASFDPDNTVLFYSGEGEYQGNAVELSPRQSNLRSALGVTGLATFAAPPQRQEGMEETPDFMYCQAQQGVPIDYRVLWIREVFDPGLFQTSYQPNQALLSKDTTRGERFLYDINRFENPRDVFIAPDEPGYIFVADAGLDSVYVFNQAGVEGVNPPPTSNRDKQVIVSFGGQGSGPFQFDDPSGVCYNRRTIYVADKNNNRIIRYRLNTDLE
jgi:DNA-binding beta-propeller fold protein YncE